MELLPGTVMLRPLVVTMLETLLLCRYGRSSVNEASRGYKELEYLSIQFLPRTSVASPLVPTISLRQILSISYDYACSTLINN
jgi:hypothetical protein